MTDLRPAAIAWAGIVAATLVVDGVLLRRGLEPLTAAARTPYGWAVQAIVAAHFARLLPPPVDPFQLLGRVATLGTGR